MGDRAEDVHGQCRCWQQHSCGILTLPLWQELAVHAGRCRADRGASTMRKIAGISRALANVALQSHTSDNRMKAGV